MTTPKSVEELAREYIYKRYIPRLKDLQNPIDETEDAFKAGYSACEEIKDARIKDLEGQRQLEHERVQKDLVDRVEYHREISALEAKVKIAEDKIEEIKLMICYSTEENAETTKAELVQLILAALHPPTNIKEGE